MKDKAPTNLFKHTMIIDYRKFLGGYGGNSGSNEKDGI